ncbi:MAG: hypothetical protein GX175_06920, partial [Halanaerobiaceae bacterium]|nr:hypothetical protein [Halanaerobiaceae bacterium]
MLDTYLTEDQFSSKEEYEKYKNSRIYPSREYFEKMNKKEEELLKIKLVIDLAKRGFSILTASSLLEKTFFELSVETGVQLLNTALGKYASEIGPVICFLLKALKDPVGFMKIIRSVDSKTIAKLIIGEMEEEENHQLYEEIKDILNDVDEGEIEFVEEINMYDEGRYKEGIDEFRVLVLKKGDDIVIAYKGRKVENKNLLPDEMECLQLVYSRITLEYPDMSIHFTGCNGGGERAFINSLLLGADRCYIVESEDNLSKISEKLFNNKDAWKDNIFKDENNNVLTIEDSISPGDKIYYSAILSGDITASIFTDNVKELENFINFTKENMESEYKPVIVFMVGITGPILTDSVKSVLERRLNQLIGNIIKPGIIAGLTKIKSGLKNLAQKDLYINMLIINTKLIVYNLSKYSVITTISTVLSYLGIGVKLLATGLLFFLKIVYSFVVLYIILHFILCIIDRITKNMMLADIYNWLEKQGYLYKEYEKIHGFIREEFLELESIEEIFVDNNGEKLIIKVEKALGIYLNYHRDKGHIYKFKKAGNGDNIILEVGDHDYHRKAKLAEIDIELKKNNNDVYNITTYYIRSNTYNRTGKEYSWSTFLSIQEKIFEIAMKIRKSNIKLQEEKDQEMIAEINNQIKELELEKDVITEGLDFFMEFEKNTLFFKRMVSVMELLGDMQRVYIDMANGNFQFIYPTNIEEKRIEIQNILPDKKIRANWIEKNKFSEYIFMPFIDKETGNIGTEIRDDYIRAIIKNILLDYFANWIYGELKKYKYSNFFSELNGYSIEIDNYQDIVNEGDDKDKYEDIIRDFCKKIIENSLALSNFINPGLSVYSTKAEFLVKKIREKISDESFHYLQIELNKNRFDLPMIIIGSENELEYKYNPDDFIIGGTLVIQDYSYLNLLKKGNKRKEEKT